MTKVCRTCGLDLPIERFAKTGKNQAFYRLDCRQCYYKRNGIPTLEENQDKNFKAHGINRTIFEALLSAQDGRCAICLTTVPGGKGTWHIDHDHNCCSGKKSCGNCVRGLLCANCNAGIGYLRDSAVVLKAAALYVSERAA